MRTITKKGINYTFILLLASWLPCCRASRTGEEQGLRLLKAAHWEKQQLAPSVTWYHCAFSNLFDTLENVNIVEVDLNDTTVRPALIIQDKLLSPTHEMAAKANALAAVNGNFFHMQEGGSVCFIKAGGQVIDTSRTDLGEKMFLDELDDAAFIIDAAGKPGIRLCPSQGWGSLTDIPTILSGGPPLLIGGRAIPLIHHGFNDHRYARTGVGLTRTHHLLLVTVDGHSDKSRGVTMNEFRTLFQYWHCTDAMNLDGGGSTTLYIRGQPFNGIVNYPTDNKKYDHTGERKVANILAIVRR